MRFFVHSANVYLKELSILYLYFATVDLKYAYKVHQFNSRQNLQYTGNEWTMICFIYILFTPSTFGMDTKNTGQLNRQPSTEQVGLM